MWGTHLLRPPPALREVHFWCVFPEDVKSLALLKHYESFLCLEERKQLDDAPCEKVRKERLLARALVRITLSRYANALISPASLRFEKNKFGKPRVVWPDAGGEAKFPCLKFNLSHTSSLIACGVSTNCELGIDVEAKTRALKADFMKLAKRRFSSKEVAWLEGFSNDRDAQRCHFLQLWTLKEAYVKALGLGISGQPLNKFSFELNKTVDKEKPTISIELLGNTEAKLDDWQFLLFEPSREHYASICVQQAGSMSFNFWRTTPLVSDASLVGGSAIAWSENLLATDQQLFEVKNCLRNYNSHSTRRPSIGESSQDLDNKRFSEQQFR